MSEQDPSALPAKTREALIASQLYYLQDLTMEAIAQELRTSRSSVSRMLSYARQIGLVEITVHSPLDEPRRIERDIRRLFGVTAHVVPVPDRISEVNRLNRVAITAARILGGFADSNMSIGVAWGSTMSAIGKHLVPKATHNSSIVQLNGAANPHTTGLLYASEILQRFGTAFGAHVQQFPVPAFFDDPATKQALWKERSIRRVLDMQASLDMAVFGLGSPLADLPSHVYSGGYLDAADFHLLAESGVVGDVATVFYREDGSHDGIALNARASGPELDVIRRTARRLCVVSGPRKLASLRGALAAGLVTDVIVDAATARTLVSGAVAPAAGGTAE